MGAEAVDLDTIKSYAKFAYLKPRRLPLKKFDEAAHDAGYTLKRVELETSGTVVESRCESCKADAKFLKLDSTGEMIELKGKVDVRRYDVARGELTDWNGSHPRLTVEPTAGTLVAD